MPSALGADNKLGLSDNVIYGIGGIILLVIIGVIVFIIMRKRKQANSENTQVSPVNSMGSANTSDADMYNNA